MAHAMFAGRPEFVRQENGFWRVAEPGAPAYSVSGGEVVVVPEPLELLKSHSFVVVDVETTGARPYAGDRITEVAAGGRPRRRIPGAFRDVW
jgi:DNA polymerase III, epsilon subunit and related 3''-5'' exonucleases